MILFVQKYETACEKRNAELSRCLKENEAAGIFEEIVLVGGRDKKWTFKEMFQKAAGEFAGKRCVIANSDISFSHPSCGLLQYVISEKWLIALTRWHDKSTPWMVGFNINNRWYSGTQDVWGFIGGQYVELGDFPMGEPGCDCRLTAAATLAGAPVWNPALTIRVMHVHDELNDTSRGSPPGDYGYAELTTAESLGGVILKTFPETRTYSYSIRPRSI